MLSDSDRRKGREIVGKEAPQAGVPLKHLTSSGGRIPAQLASVVGNKFSSQGETAMSQAEDLTVRVLPPYQTCSGTQKQDCSTCLQ